MHASTSRTCNYTHLWRQRTTSICAFPSPSCPTTPSNNTAREKAKNGFVYVECRRCVYGLPHAGALANKLPEEQLAPAGYFEVNRTPGLWRHVSRPVAFSLAVDNFGMKYAGREHANHLAAAIKKYYPLSEDWDGGLYLGVHLDWNYEKRWVDCCMKDYVLKGLQKFKHSPPENPQHSPFPIPPCKFGRAAQEPDPLDESPLVDDDVKMLVQRVVGTFYIMHRRSIRRYCPASPPWLASSRTQPRRR
ncbi:hypothetical protein ACHAWF_007911 [Thalassiosira exigua]